MLIKLVETVVFLFLCFSVTTSLINSKSERTSKQPVYSTKMVIPKTIPSSSRYMEFDKVLTRINQMNYDDDVSDPIVYRIRHKGWSNRKAPTTPSTTTTTEMDLFETYGDLEDDDYFDDYEDTEDGDEIEYEDEEEDNLFDEIQAEEPTEKPTTPSPRPISKLTEYKWNHFGTREKVEESMRQYLNPSKEQLTVKAVIDHYARVNQQSKCRNPLPRVISVQQEHPDPTRTYIPACTVLYRCAEDSGCCKRDTKCQFNTRELVSLYFYAKVIGQDHNTIERLDFYNHTECACKERTEYIPPESGKDPDTKITSEAEFQSTTGQKNRERCRCPKSFRALMEPETCACDCDKNEQDCNQLKKGKEHFNIVDRICIQDGECGVPRCEYGSYKMKAGKCPTKHDKLEEFRKMRIDD